MITLNALFARLAVRLAQVARRRALTDAAGLDPTTLFVPIDDGPGDLTTPFTADAGLRGPNGTWIEGPFVRDAGTLEIRW